MHIKLGNLHVATPTVMVEMFSEFWMKYRGRIWSFFHYEELTPTKEEAAMKGYCEEQDMLHLSNDMDSFYEAMFRCITI